MEIHVTAILMQMLNFGIVVGALSVLLLKPVRKILDERARKIAEGQAAAEAALKEKSQIAQLKDKAEQDAKQSAKSLLADARKEAEARKNELLHEAKAEVEEARAKMMKALDREKATVMESWQADFEKAVLTVSEHVMGEALDAKKHAKLIAQGLKDIAATK